MLFRPGSWPHESGMARDPFSMPNVSLGNLLEWPYQVVVVSGLAFRINQPPSTLDTPSPARCVRLARHAILVLTEWG